MKTSVRVPSYVRKVPYLNKEKQQTTRETDGLRFGRTEYVAAFVRPFSTFVLSDSLRFVRDGYAVYYAVVFSSGSK